CFLIRQLAIPTPFPYTTLFRSTIANLGQRQAVLHDVSTALGVYRDSGTPALVPLAKRDLDDGRMGIFVLPQDKDIEKAIRVISRSEEHTSELQSRENLVCRLLL